MVVVSLNEDRPLVPLADGGGNHDGGKFGRPLQGVTGLGAGQFKDEGADFQPLGGANHRTRHIVTQTADIDSRDRKSATFLPSISHVQLMNGRRDNTGLQPRLANDPTSDTANFVTLSKHGVPDQLIDGLGAELLQVLDMQTFFSSHFINGTITNE